MNYATLIVMMTAAQPVVPSAGIGRLSPVLPSAFSKGSLEEVLQQREQAGCVAQIPKLHAHMRSSPEAGVRDTAQYEIARCLVELRYFGAAAFYFGELYRQGATHPYYAQAAQGLVELQRQMRDPSALALMLERSFDGAALGVLGPETIAYLNALLGERALRADQHDTARAFLRAVVPLSDAYPRAQYLMALSEYDGDRPDYAVARLERLVKDGDDSTVRTALAQMYYGMARYSRARQHLNEVAPFAPGFRRTLVVRAWTAFRQERFERVLGLSESLRSPYGADEYVPELFLLEGLTYLRLCQWDRVRRSVSRFRDHVAGVADRLNGLLQGPTPWPDWETRLGKRLTREVRGIRRYADYAFVLRHLAWERGDIAARTAWKTRGLRDDLIAVTEQLQDAYANGVWVWLRRRVENLQQNLNHLTAQVDILEFETVDAERRWLEEGREILQARRERVPRPELPTDQWHHWEVQTESWKDELGAYVVAVRSECR